MSDPFTIAIITGSPTVPSRSAAVARLAELKLGQGAFRARTIQVRDLPASALLHAQTDAPEFVSARELIEKADGVIVASPVYKASYSGVLKTFLDLLPQFALRGKVVLPLLTGGTLAHVLALDYALRPVLQSLDARLIVPGLFLLDAWVTKQDDGSATLADDVAPRFDAAVRAFVDGIRCFSEA
jgi:FMN reductase